MNRYRMTRAEKLIVGAGAAMLFGSFLDFSLGRSAWSSGWFPVVTLIPMYGVLMGLQILLARYARVELPDEVAGFTWEQLHIAVGAFAALMAACWMLGSSNRQIGMLILTLGAFVSLGGAVKLQSERQTDALG